MANNFSRILVTGGTAGIGLATAALLLRKGSRVFICGRNKNRLAEALVHLQGIAGSENVSGTQCDVGNYDEAAAMVARAVDFLGILDALVNSAGVATVAPFEKLSPEDWQTMLNVNLTGVFNCCKAAVPALKKSDHPNIINLGSRAGRYAFAGGTGYNTTKFGLQGFSEALFLDLNQHGIGVSLVAPSTVETGLVDVRDEDWNLQPEDVAKVIVDLLGNDKRANVNWVEIRSGLPRQN